MDASITRVEDDVILAKLVAFNVDILDYTTYVFENVLMLDGKVGTPYVEGATVKAVCEKHGKAKKIIVYKYKSKKNYHKKQGHRQPYTKLKVVAIEG